MARFTINGVTFTGNTVQIRNGEVIIDGQKQDGSLSGVFEVRVIEGAIHRLETDASVNCGPVTGGISAGGSVNCDSVSGSVSAGGSVNCDRVGGSVTAGGSVRMS